MNKKVGLFPRDTVVNDRGHLVIGRCDAEELVESYGTPLYVFDEKTIRLRCREFKTEFGSRYKGAVVAYAGKAFLHTAMVRLLNEEEMFLDVVSGGELFIAKAAGFPAEKIYFHGNNKSIDELSEALDYKIGRIVVDNIHELESIGALCEKRGCRQKILLRITPEVMACTHSHIATGEIGSKFGFPLDDVANAVRRSASLPSIELMGFHFHMGSMISDVEVYLKAIDVVLGITADLKKNKGFTLLELNIGGGYAVPYTTNDMVPEISWYAEMITGRIITKCKEYEMILPRLTIEPGRSIVAQAGVAFYRVGSIKDVPGPIRYVAVDGGMADNIRPALYDACYDPVLALRMKEPEIEIVSVAGRFCESGDVLVRDIMLPGVRTGDLIAVPVCGAYCIPMSSNYNATCKPPIVFLRYGKAILVRRRETYRDLLHCDVT